ncbi:MAG: hypothetical protein ACI9SE_002473, partial [Neolewinella sp.]
MQDKPDAPPSANQPSQGKQPGWAAALDRRDSAWKMDMAAKVIV